MIGLTLLGIDVASFYAGLIYGAALALLAVAFWRLSS